MGIKSRALRPFCAIRVCVYLVNSHANKIFEGYDNDIALLKYNVQIMPRDGINSPQTVIFPQLFSVYRLKFSLHFCLKRGF